MRGALIGCGFFASNHLHAWADMRAQGVELVAVCDVDRAKATTAARAFGIDGVYDDAEALLAEIPLDFVDIATRMDTHRALAGAAARRGVAAIVQKPLAATLEEAGGIVEAARAAGSRIAVHENFRFQPPIRRLRQEIDAGVLGIPSWARLSFRTGFDVYRNQPYFHREPRLVILDLGVHLLDVARFLLGEVERVACETQRRNPANVGEDTATILLRHVSGAVSVVECTYEARIHPDPFPATVIHVEGNAGSLQLRADQTIVRANAAGSEVVALEPAQLSWSEEPWRVVQESVLRTQQAILGAWRRGVEAETSGADNLRTLALVDAAYRAAETGQTISIARS